MNLISISQGTNQDIKSDNIKIIGLKMTSEIKICPQCNRLYQEKQECPKCNIELESLEAYAQKLDKCLEYMRGVHIDYIDPSYAEEHKKEGMNNYFKAYMTLLRVDPLNREKYLYGLVKVYDIFDGGYDYLSKLDHRVVLKILGRLLEYDPDNEDYLYIKLRYLFYEEREYKEALEIANRLLEMDSENEDYIFFKEAALEEIGEEPDEEYFKLMF